MAAQLAIEALGARRSIAKINDPVRAEAYAHLGIATLCRTNLMTTAVLGYAGQAAPVHPGIYAPENPHVHVGEGAEPSPVALANAASSGAPGSFPGTAGPGGAGASTATGSTPGAGPTGSEG